MHLKTLQSFFKQILKPFSTSTSTLTLFLFSTSVFSQINTSTSSLYSFRQVYTDNMSDVQFYDVQASNLNSSLEITAESPFMISLDCHDQFQSSLSITPSSGNVNKRIFVRAFPSGTGNFNVKIIHSSDGFANKEVSVHVQAVASQIPSNYYSNATSTGSRLKTELHNIIDNHNSQSYSSLWSHFENTDATFSGNVWDIYSDTPCSEPPYTFTFFSDQDSGSGGNSEGDVYNREHSMPASWFNDGSPMYTDMFHLYPTDKWVNAKRSNYPYGEVSSASWTSLNGSKLGNISVPGYSGPAFEPRDDYKGDLARTYLYMITRYEDKIENWTYTSEAMSMLDNQKYPGYKDWALDMLVEWHEADQVSQKEIERNNAIYAIQGNRNPYIDHPEFVEKIWVDTTDTFISNHISNKLNIYPNPVNDELFYEAGHEIKAINIYSCTGQLILSSNEEKRNGSLDVTALSEGVYIIKFETIYNTITRKIIISL